MPPDDQPTTFPVGLEFFDLHRKTAEQASETTEQMQRHSGIKLPATTEGLGTVLSIMYRAACCGFGCNGGDHQLEWLVGRVVNQANAAFSLIRSASYDESLMLTRGIGEIANLLWLFQNDSSTKDAWRNADRRERMNRFGPAAVRKALNQLGGIGPPVDDARYQKLCEVGTHPVPGIAPSHFTGTGRPVLSGLVQPVGVYVATTELSYAVAMCGTPTATIVIQDQEMRQSLFTASVTLIRSLGSFTVLNYEEKLAELQSKGQNEVSQLH